MFENMIQSSYTTDIVFFVALESRALNRHAMQEIKFHADV